MSKATQGYWCRPSKHWAFSYRGSMYSSLAGDYYWNGVEVFAGEGMIRIITNERKPPKFILTGYEFVKVRNGSNLHIYCRRTPKCFYYAYWNPEGGGRYGLVLRSDDETGLSELSYKRWQAKITTRMIQGFNNWFKMICAKTDTPEFVKGTQKHFESNNFQLELAPTSF